MLTAGEVVVLRDFLVEVSVDDVLRAQGADPERVRSRGSAALDVAQDALELSRGLMTPSAVLGCFAVRSVRHHVIRLDAGRLSGALVAERLARASEVIVAVCTIGPGVETASSDCFDTDPALAMALDAVGSAGVERVTAAVKGRILADAALRGFRVGSPATPGDHAWPVGAGQPQLFELVDASSIGVSLTSSSMMTPQKSTSMVFGVGPHISLDDQSECARCDLAERCRFREAHESLVPR